MIPVAGTSVAAGLSISDHNVIGEQDGIHSRDLLECRPWRPDSYTDVPPGDCSRNPHGQSLFQKDCGIQAGAAA